MSNEIETETLKEARRMIVRVLKAEGFPEVAETLRMRWISNVELLAMLIQVSDQMAAETSNDG